MHILQHPDVQQIGEERSPDGALFAPVLSLSGRKDLRECAGALEHSLVALAQADFRSGKYRAVFINPAEVVEDDPSRELLEDNAMISNLMRGGDISYNDERGGETYNAACLHQHMIASSASTLCIRSGAMPTFFVTDDRELDALLIRSAPCIQDVAGKCVRQALCQSFCSSRQRAMGLMNAMLEDFSGFPPKKRAEMLLLQNALKRDLEGKCNRTSTLGNMSIFAGDVIHAAGLWDDSSKNEPGELYAQRWGSR